MQNELKKQYVGVFEAWKIDLALGRIKAMGFGRSDWPDLMQELAIVMLEFRYDPKKSNGATEQTVFYEVINRNLLQQMRTRCRDAARLKRYASEMGVKADGTGEEPCCYLSAPVDMDVALICSISYMLANRFYVGDIVWRGQTYPGKHRPLVEHQTFQLCRDILKGKNRRTTRWTHTLLAESLGGWNQQERIVQELGL